MLDKDEMRVIGMSLLIFGVLFTFAGALISLSIQWGTGGLVGVEILALVLATLGGGLFEYGRTPVKNKEQVTSA